MTSADSLESLTYGSTRHFTAWRSTCSRGGIASLVEKKTGRELVDRTSPYALGQFLHERFSNQQMADFTRAYARRLRLCPRRPARRMRRMRR